MNRVDITRKASDIARDVEMLEARGVMWAEVHGSEAQHASTTDQAAFQRARLEAAQWASTATDVDIRQRIDEVHAQLGVYAAAKYGPQVGLPAAVTTQIAIVELYELALGEHPVQGR